jgi:hypothetical protein
VSTDQIVHHLVGQGTRVFEIAPEERTLEDFYLSLMKLEANEPGSHEAGTRN